MDAPSLAASLQARELGASFARTRRECEHRRPHGMFERKLEPAQDFNKIFAQVWLDEERFVTGSKDNRLALWTSESEYTALDLPPAVTALVRIVSRFVSLVVAH